MNEPSSPGTGTPVTGTLGQQTLKGHGASSRRGSHRLADAEGCPRKWWLRYARRLVPVEEKQATFAGTLAHLGLEYFYNSKLPVPEEKPFPTFEAAIEERGRGDPNAIRNAIDCVRAYIVWEAGDPLVPLAVEEEFVATVGEIDPGGPDASLDDEIVTCKPDLIARNCGYVGMYDHKTEGVWGRGNRLPILKTDGRYTLSWQAMLNLHIIRCRKEDPRGIAECASFTLNRIKKDVPFDFDRYPLRMRQPAYEDVPRLIRKKVAAEREFIRALERGERLGPDFTHCHGPYGVCDYAPLCQSDSKEEMALNMQYLFKVSE